MYKLYSKQEMVDAFALKVERTSLPYDSDLILSIHNFGECHTQFIPVKFIEQSRTDIVVALYPKTLFWQTEPLYYAFLSDIEAQ